MRVSAFLALMLSLVSFPSGASAERFITLASTTSTENSGLFGEILPEFTRDTGIGVHVIAAGTGQALTLGRNGDADLVLVHHRASEDAFMAAGFGVSRHDVMHNDFVIAGPADDKAGLRQSATAREAFRRIADTKVPFISRGDDSGTHKREMEIWRAAAVTPSPRWRHATGAGMGTTMNIAAAMGAYVLADRASWNAFGNKRGLELLFEGDPVLFNPYGIMIVNPVRHPHVKLVDAAVFVGWLTSEAGRAAINAFRIGGRQMFFATPPVD